MIDLVVVGAGVAGLAAAKSARAAGLRIVLLEAARRIGGRAHTDSETFGVPFDRGCHWLHSAGINPLTRVASDYGFTVLRHAWQPLVHTGGGWADEEERAEMRSFYESSLAAIVEAGNAGRDIALTDVIDTGSRWWPLLGHWLAAITGVEADRYSTLAYASDNDTGENWPIKEGYGALVARYGADVPVELATPVRRIAWDEHGVQVETAHGTIAAAAVIVTASTGVLAEGLIAFDPPLPPWKREAIEAFPMGQANKVALAFDRDVLDAGDDSYAISLASAPDTMGFQLRPFGRRLAIGYVAGDYCATLERAGSEAMTDRAVEILSSMFGSAVRRTLTKTATTAWQAEPYIRGAYSAALPGRAHLRADLAAPLGGRIFFAGEAASAEFFSTAHGAYLTGIASAEAVARTLRGCP